MSVEIVFETHSITVDNERGIASAGGGGGGRPGRTIRTIAEEVRSL